MRRPPTARVEAAPLAGEGHEALERAVGASQSREAVVEHAAREELAELLPDEPGQAAAVAAIRAFAEEWLQVLPNDGVEHGALGVAGLIRAVRIGHALA